eukprot:scaffold18532_cov144-Skeletonema_marinoi.AAC.2
MAEIPSSIARRCHVKRLWQRFQFHCSEVTSTREWRPEGNGIPTDRIPKTIEIDLAKPSATQKS